MKIDPLEFRQALGQFPTGVTVVTTQGQDAKPFGITVNSFASVSLEPPLVLWSIQNDSDSYEAFKAAKTFVINVLADHQQHLSVNCAQKGGYSLAENEYTLNESGSAILHDSIVSFECSQENWFAGGDHSIIVGRVLSMTAPSNAQPLVFHAGEYGAMAKI